MKPIIRPAEPSEPAVLNPQLAQLVQLAREQPSPPLRVDADRVHAGFLAARQSQRRRLTLVGGLVLAAAAAVALVITRVDLGVTQETGPKGQVAQDMSPKPAAESPVVPRGPILAPGVRVVASGEDTPTPTVLGPWEVGLAPGRYAVEVDEHPGPELLRARSAGGTVELHHGRVEIVIAGDSTTATLREGVATWVAPDGTRSELQPDGDDVRALARRADALLAAGQREAAIEVLTRIVTGHPQEAAARGALLDLAPLLKEFGRVDEARCAYRLYLDRYPGKPQLAGDVEKALGRLGAGPACDGLQPR